MSLRNRIDALKGGMLITKHGNNLEFWSIIWGRPSAFFLLLIVADWRRVTPNILTHLSNVFLIFACLLILDHQYTNWLWAAVFINISMTFDCADGQLARYRKGAASELGSFYDKVSDAVGMVLLFSLLGWVAAEQSGEMKYLLFGTLGAAGQITGGYSKWVCMSVLYRRNHVSESTELDYPLWQYPFQILLRSLYFCEGDLPFWVGLGLILNHLDWTLWMFVLTQPPVALVTLGVYALKVARSDKRQQAEDAAAAAT